MNRAPAADTKPTCEEIAFAEAYMAWKRNPTPENAKARQAAFFAAKGYEWMPVLCEYCGLHRSYLKPEDPCRLCGRPRQTSAP